MELPATAESWKDLNPRRKHSTTKEATAYLTELSQLIISSIVFSAALYFNMKLGMDIITLWLDKHDQDNVYGNCTGYPKNCAKFQCMFSRNNGLSRSNNSDSVFVSDIIIRMND